jgi:hypothetical protein
MNSCGGTDRTGRQTTFASLAWEKKGKITRRERFLAEMDAVIPWSRLPDRIEPHYPKAGNVTQPKPMERLLRVYFMENWFNLLDPQAEDSLYDIEPMRRFAVQLSCYWRPLISPSAALWATSLNPNARGMRLRPEAATCFGLADLGTICDNASIIRST